MTLIRFSHIRRAIHIQASVCLLFVTNAIASTISTPAPNLGISNTSVIVLNPNWIEFKTGANSLQWPIQKKITFTDPLGNQFTVVAAGIEEKNDAGVFIFDETSNLKGSYRKLPLCPYPDTLFLFRCETLRVFNVNNKSYIFAIFRDDYYPTVLLVLDTDGKLLKQFWHPGHLFQIEQYKDLFVLEGVNNMWDRPAPTRAQRPPRLEGDKHQPVIFALKFDDIDGFGPEPWSDFEPVPNFAWYYRSSSVGMLFNPPEVKSSPQILTVETENSVVYSFDRNGYLGKAHRFEYTVVPQTLFAFKQDKTWEIVDVDDTKASSMWQYGPTKYPIIWLLVCIITVAAIVFWMFKRPSKPRPSSPLADDPFTKPGDVRVNLKIMDVLAAALESLKGVPFLGEAIAAPILRLYDTESQQRVEREFRNILNANGVLSNAVLTQVLELKQRLNLKDDRDVEIVADAVTTKINHTLGQDVELSKWPLVLTRSLVFRELNMLFDEDMQPVRTALAANGFHIRPRDVDADQILNYFLGTITGGDDRAIQAVFASLSTKRSGSKILAVLASNTFGR
ncbi:MAG TPA: hypothetical protein VGN88_13600 [Phycisphaerae bacterium]